MRRIALGVLALSVSCANHDQLKVIEARLKQQVYDYQEVADHFPDRLAEFEMLEEKISLVNADLVDAGMDAKPMYWGPKFVEKLPPVSAFEGSTGRELRESIQDKLVRIATLERRLGKVVNINRRKKEFEDKTARLQKAVRVPSP